MAHVSAPTAQAAHAGPRSAAPPPQPPPSQQQQQPPQSERSEQKRNLATWWNQFKRSDKKPQEQPAAPQGIFGVPLQDSIRYANVAISLFNDAGESYIYGYVPIVVAKCGVFLKEKATDVEGIFRLAGSEKRIKELKVSFDSPDRYGKGLDWTGYTVHDAANILRRYFNQLPEPIIPLDFYNRFREPLRNHQAQAVGELEAQSPSVGHFDHNAAIRRFQGLITELPPLNRQLLLYILDLLAVFASKSDLNKMTTANLSAIFQPGILSHPQHDMAPPEYRLSQDVLIFLIENQDSFLIGMQGTAADPETVREVQSGSPAKPPGTPTTPGRSKTIVGRTASNASAGAESVGKFGSIRRNVSLSSSKRSKRSDGGPTIVAGLITDPATPSSGVHRSNTVPSRRGGSNTASPRFPQKNSDPATPSPSNTSAVNVEASKQRQESLQSTPVVGIAPQFPAAPHVTSASSSEATTPLARIGSDTSSAVGRDYQTPKKDTTPLLSPPPGGERKTERSLSGTPSTTSGRALLDIFKQSPGSDDGRKPNKLQKKRIPGSALSSAQSSNQSLPHDGASDAPQRSPVISNFPPAAFVMAEGRSEDASAQVTPTGTSLQPQQETPRKISGENALRPSVSPAHSFHSTAESDADMVGDDLPQEQVQQPEKEKKRHRWRFSRTQNKLDSTPQGSPNPLGTMTAQDQTTSRSTIGSSGAAPRGSFQDPTPVRTTPSDPSSGTPFGSPPMQPQSDTGVFSDSEREKRSGPISWFRKHLKDGGKEKEYEKRARTPERRTGSKQDLGVMNEPLPGRGKSLEQQRVGSGTGAGFAAGAQQQQQQQQPQMQTSAGGSPHAVTAAQAALGHAGGSTTRSVRSPSYGATSAASAAAASPAVAQPAPTSAPAMTPQPTTNTTAPQSSDAAAPAPTGVPTATVGENMTTSENPSVPERAAEAAPPPAVPMASTTGQHEEVAQTGQESSKNEEGGGQSELPLR
ncbi:GTPase activating protein (GAP) for Rho1p [Saxophila tyrrhenica]|uniref:GTPase activating protein (GAP) for Rho1p n=1 Tax=Saxophila tyrrhenica TaxID=1690608 RepID=A0AAV9PE53_9PEZI|nr:GTPase activating protein (GAP) for Rho1p [Saxophila tyrrhenica]